MPRASRPRALRLFSFRASSARYSSIARCVCSVWLIGAFIPGCAPETPPKPEPAERPNAAAAQDSVDDTGGGDVWLEADAEAIIITYAADRGRFEDTSKREDVPDEAKGLVRVKLLAGPRAPAGTVWVTNLGEFDGATRSKLRPIERDMFEELALGEGRSSVVQVPDGLELPDVVPASEEVIVYKTSWCGVCKQVMAYLDKKGIAYVAKDIEKDQAAAAELQAKARAKGVGTGSVPVLDVHGELIVGFDRKRLESLF